MADTQSARTMAYSNAPFSTWLGIVFLFVLFGLIVLAVIGPSPRSSDYEETRAKKRMEKLNALQEENKKDLTTYAWIDKNKGVARIPIDRAMEVTVAELAQKKPAPAGPIATPAAQAPPAGTSAAPAASPQGAAVSSSPAEAAAKAGPSPSGAPQQPQTGAPAASPAAQSSAPSPTAQQSPPAAASPAPATTP